LRLAIEVDRETLLDPETNDSSRFDCASQETVLVLETFRRLLAFVEPGRRAAWIGVALLAFVVTAFEVIAALLIFIVTQLAASGGRSLDLPIIGDPRARFSSLSDRQVVMLAMAVIAVFFIVRAVVVLMQSYLQDRLAEETAVRLSTRLFQGYLDMPYSFHLQRNSAELMRNVNEAIKDIVDYTLMPALRIGSDALVIIGLGIVLVLTAPLAAGLGAVLFVPLMVLLLRGIQPRIAGLGKTSHEMNRSALAVLQQSLHGFRDIKILGRSSYFHDRYEDIRAKIARTRYLRQFLGDIPRIALETGLILFVALFMVAALSFGGSAQSSLAVLGMFAYAALRILPSLNRVVLQINDLKFGAAAAADVHEDLKVIEQRTSASSTTSMPGNSVEPLQFKRAILLDGVTYRYPGADHDALVEVNLEIKHGEALGVVGPTGGGKTTLMDLILGLLRPTAGRVLVDGVDIQGYLDDWHRRLGVVSQAVYLLDTTLRRNIALGLDDEAIDEDRIREVMHLAQLDEFVASLPMGLETEVGDRGTRLSGGERQRVAIARALYRRPTVVVFDEGTSALDPATEAGLLRALEPLRTDRTMITVAHRLTTVRDSDRIVLVDAGRLVDTGHFDELLERSAAFRRLAAARTSTGVTDEDGAHHAWEGK
jgi:ABC-type multidrug transport system fused ATPase/permease subunit